MRPDRARPPALAAAASESCTVWTVGHSTLEADEFLSLLTAHDIEAVADVRRFPGSKRYPHFAEPALRASLLSRGLEYSWLPSLGGRRSPAPDSPNTGWRNDSFRGYADHIGTEEFAAGLRDLCKLARRKRTAIMCAEAVWWRCHRSLIADVLKSTGWIVMHILGETSVKEHPYTSPARIIDGRLTYPADQLSLGD